MTDAFNSFFGTSCVF